MGPATDPLRGRNKRALAPAGLLERPRDWSKVWSGRGHGERKRPAMASFEEELRKNGNVYNISFKEYTNAQIGEHRRTHVTRAS